MKKSFLIFLNLLLALSVSCSKKVDVKTNELNFSVGAEIKGFDPIYAEDSYSGGQIALVYESLLQFHYLKRPYTLEPNLAAEMPNVSSDGLTYTFKLKKGVMFHDSPAFPNGKGAELTAKDVEYTIKRVADPKLQSTGWWLFQDKIAGLDAWRKKYATAEGVNYDEKIEGLTVVDDHTIQFKLAKPFPQFLYSLAMSFSYVVSRKAVEHYGKDFINFPVGTGPFVLPEFKRGKKIVYTKNPNYREEKYPSAGEEADKANGLLADAGKKLPLADKVTIHIMPESQPQWLNFLKGKLDRMGIPKDNFEQAISAGKLSDEMIKKGISLDISPGLDVTYIAFNTEDQLFKNNVNLRRAMSLAYNVEESNTKFYNKLGVPAQSVIPPGIAGYDPNYKNPFSVHDIAKAKEFMKKAGFPDGKGLPVINYETTATTIARQMAEFFAMKMKDIGVIVNVSTNTWPELMKKVKAKQAMMYGMSWLADYPDAENFLQLLYGPNKAPGSNGSNFDDPAFNEMFKTSSVMQDSPKRSEIYKSAAQYLADQVPWILGIHRLNYGLSQGWLRNFKESAFNHGNMKYYGVDLAKKQELIKNF